MRSDSLTLFVKLCLTETFQITFKSYIMKKNELYSINYNYFTRAGQTETVPLQARHQLEIVFLRSALVETADQTSQCDYRPKVIGSDQSEHRYFLARFKGKEHF